MVGEVRADDGADETPGVKDDILRASAVSAILGKEYVVRALTISSCTVEFVIPALSSIVPR